MNLFISLRSELLKTKRTALLFLCFLVAAIIPLMLLFEFSTDARAITTLKADPWNLYFKEGRQALNMLFLPMYVILICTLLPQIEYRNNTWKQVFTSPQPVANIFLSKFLIIHLLIFLFFIAYNMFMASTAIAVHLIKPKIGFSEHSIDWPRLMIANGSTYISVLAISTVQFWAGLRFKNFITPIGIGFSLWMVAGMLVYEFEWEHADKFPFAYPILSLFPKYQSDAFLAWTSLGYAVLFVALAFIDFKFRKAKG